MLVRVQSVIAIAIRHAIGALTDVCEEELVCAGLKRSGLRPVPSGFEPVSILAEFCGYSCDAFLTTLVA